MQKILARPKILTRLACSFIVSGLAWKPAVHFELIFVTGERQGQSFILLQVGTLS